MSDRNVFHWLGDQWENAEDWVEDKADAVGEWFGDRVEDVQEFGEDVVDWGKEQIDNVVDTAQGAVEWAKENDLGRRMLFGPIGYAAVTQAGEWREELAAKAAQLQQDMEVANAEYNASPGASFITFPEHFDLSDSMVDALAAQGVEIHDVSMDMLEGENMFDKAIAAKGIENGNAFVITYPHENQDAIYELLEDSGIHVNDLSDDLAESLTKEPEKEAPVKDPETGKYANGSYSGSHIADNEMIKAGIDPKTGEKMEKEEPETEKEEVEAEEVEAEEVESAEFNKPVTATYEVQPGDNLSTIAKELGVDMQHLVEMNGIENPNIIHPGDVYTYEVPTVEVDAEEFEAEGEEADMTRELPEGWDAALAQYEEAERAERMAEVEERLASMNGTAASAARDGMIQAMENELQEDISLFTAAYTGSEDVSAEFEGDKQQIAEYQEFIGEMSGMTQGEVGIEAQDDFQMGE